MTCARLKVAELLNALFGTYSDTTAIVVIVMVVEIHTLAHYLES